MSKLVYAKITTNRATLTKYVEKFRREKNQSESLVAPRPLPGRAQISYYALLTLEEHSPLHSYFSDLGKVMVMTKKQYQQELGTLTHYWSA